MKKLISFILLLCVTIGLFASCSVPDDSSSNLPPWVDYVTNLTLDMNSETKKQEVTVKAFIDGDTTHFNVPTSISADKTMKARYIAVNTPESTGKIEEWGKKAAAFTKSKLSSATSIIVETNGDKWEFDSTGERHLVWVWYKPEGSDTYRNLNMEILQNGLAVGSNAGGTRYGTTCISVINQAKTYSMHVYSDEKDPDYFYGTAYEVDLKELRTNIQTYSGSKVAFEGYISYYSSQGVYVENYDEETQMWYGMYVYYGFFLDPIAQTTVLAVGNKVRIVGSLQYYETGGTWQVSDLKYDLFDSTNPENIQRLDTEKYNPAHVETTAETFKSQKEIEMETEDGTTKKTFPYAELALDTSISMKNLVVQSAKTTNNGGDNDGAMTLTCKVDGKTVTVRTTVMKDANNNLITQDQFIGKTIDVTGIVEYFSGSYQIKVFNMNNITIHS